MFTAITNLIQSKSTGIGPTVKQQLQELVKNIRRKSRSESLGQDQTDSSYNTQYSPRSSPRLSPGSSPPKSSPKSYPGSSPPKSDTLEIPTGEFAYHQGLVLEEIKKSLSRHTRYRNIGDDMNENWLFENSSVTLEATNCHVCGEYRMTSNYDFYVDVLPPKCMCKCEH
jgi:hypothetical protein